MAGFQDKAVRQGFTRKVLGIVAVQLIVTMLFSLAFYYSAPLKVCRLLRHHELLHCRAGMMTCLHATCDQQVLSRHCFHLLVAPGHFFLP